MLWDLIRDWFVQYIWGGCTSNGNFYGGFLGYLGYDTGDVIGEDAFSTNNFTINVGGAYFSGEGDILNARYMNIGDWLSTTSTIIVLVALVIFFFFIIRYLFRLTSGLIRGR